MTNAEIDALIATQIMGWKLLTTGWYKQSDKGEWLLMSRGWQPTTDIAQAFQVAIRMKELGWQVDLDMYPDEKPGCSLWKTGSQTDAYVEGDSMPLAICVASLRVLGVEVAE